MTSVTKTIATTQLAATVFLLIMVMFGNKSFTKDYYKNFIKETNHNQGLIITHCSRALLAKLPALS
jgi:hypothetical protein